MLLRAMDYHARHGQDVCSFDLPSMHRMPTVSAAQALDELEAGLSSVVSTGLPDLDRALTGTTASEPGGDGIHLKRGIPKGQITELWGPPGVGKTALGVQAASNVLRDDNSVVWVDCFHPVCRDRITDLCAAAAAGSDTAPSDPLDKLVHYCCPSLAHFVALLCRPTQSSLPVDTALVVVDSLSALVNHAFPRTPAPKAANKGNNKGPSPSARRIQLLQYVVNALQKLAATRDAAVVVLTQCATRMQAERGATLIPAINANVWEQGIATRVALFREWVWHEGQASGTRLAAVQKVNGKVTPDALEQVYAFDVQLTGLVPVDYDGDQPVGAVSYIPAQKRKLDETGFEVPDSEDDEYGWHEEYNSALPGQPPQWQGSEDILLGQHPKMDDQDGGSEGDDTDPEVEQLPSET